jgi:hypothetical protein
VAISLLTSDPIDRVKAAAARGSLADLPPMAAAPGPVEFAELCTEADEATGRACRGSHGIQPIVPALFSVSMRAVIWPR